MGWQVIVRERGTLSHKRTISTWKTETTNLRGGVGCVSRSHGRDGPLGPDVCTENESGFSRLLDKCVHDLVYACVCACVRVLVHTSPSPIDRHVCNTHTLTHILHTLTHTRSQTRTHTHTQTYTRAHTHTHAHSLTHTHTQTRTHTHTHTHTHI